MTTAEPKRSEKLSVDGPLPELPDGELPLLARLGAIVRAAGPS